MPLATDVAWSHALVKTFDIARNSTSENPYLGAHLKLITYCFDRSFDFTYVCQTGDSMVYLVVFDDVRPEQCPVFLIQVNDDEHKLSLTERQAADEKMRKRYNDLLRDCPIPSLYGLSVMGTRMQVYCGDKEARVGLNEWIVAPPFVKADSHSRFSPDDYLEDRWSVDILSPEGKYCGNEKDHCFHQGRKQQAPPTTKDGRRAGRGWLIGLLLVSMLPGAALLLGIVYSKAVHLFPS
ncbi:hypothetical protein C8F01DRAFT_1105521 [Mycena amicta]|nr:hypothetical protein C8F01DRAFT_1105521 [Mycena amicta]